MLIKILGGALATSLIVLALVFNLFVTKYEEARTLQLQVDSYEASVKELNKFYLKEKEISKRAMQEVAELKSYQTERALELLEKKPTLMQKKINDAFVDQQLRISCITGGICPEE